MRGPYGPFGPFGPYPGTPEERRRARFRALLHQPAWARDRVRRAAREALPLAAYVSHDAEARWILERDTPGVFAAARAVNRLRVLSAVPVCPGCDGQGFCQCDTHTLTAVMLRDAGPLARPEFD
jgi:hypothetical protein